jgi:signal transduction histidine kinase
LENLISPIRFVYKYIYLLIIAAWLITISFVIDNYWSASSSLTTVQRKIHSYIHNREQDFKQLVKDSVNLQKIVNQDIDEKFLESITKKDYFIFFYAVSDTSSDNLICWNTQKVLPLPFMLYNNERNGFVKLDNGYYVWDRIEMGKLKCIELIPVKWDYFIENEYLQNNFAVDKSISLNYDLTDKPKNALLIKDLEENELFYVYEKRSAVVQHSNTFAVYLQIIAFFLILYFIHLLATFYSRNKNLAIGMMILFILVFALRIWSYAKSFPFHFRQFDVFDPTIYGNGIVLRSLGDLFINTSLVIWFVFFLRSRLIEMGYELKPKSAVARILLLVVFSIVIILATYLLSNILRSLVVDSQISFDVINFFTLNYFSVVGFIELCLLSICYYFICHTILNIIKPCYYKNIFLLLISNTVISLLLLSFNVGNIKGGFEIYVLIWLVIFLLLLHTSISEFLTTRIVSSKLVFWLVFFSISVSMVILTENRKKEFESRRHYAEILALKSDPANETLIHSMLLDFRDEFLTTNFNRLASPSSSIALKDSLINSNTIGYTNKYDTHLYAYKADETPLYNEDAVTFKDLNSILLSQAKPTNVPGLFYFDQSFDLFSYISKKEIKDSMGNPLGSLFIITSPKQQRKDALYPELFTKGKLNSIENSTAYAFALYHDWKLISSHNDYPFPSVLKQTDLQQKEFGELNNGNYKELRYYAGAGKVVIIAKENNWSIETITLFSYMFCCFLIVSGFLWIIHILVVSRLNRKKIISYWQFSIRNQIHGTIIFISVVSFLVIGFATILFFIIHYESSNREKLSRVIRIMEKEVNSTINEGWNLTDSAANNTASYDKKLELAVQKISDIHGVDVNLYDLNGNLRISSLPLPYTQGILSSKMDPIAYFHLNNKKEIQFFHNENIGNLTFISNYIPVINADGDNYAFINIPYFTSQNILKQEISNFLITIINLNAFIFLLAGIASLFITNRISNTFSLITEKMKRINLGSNNEVIEWDRNDEIGALVMEYNKMVNKLEASAAILAKTEREGAWKEMARQVAHEIKNPLTPMKLSMQFLQKSIDNNAPNINELAKNVSATLIEQIEHLSNIANAFSQFANIGDPKKEVFDLNDTLRNVILLHEVNDNLKINRHLLSEKIIIRADKTQINRLFTNLILNAIQSVPESRAVEITIAEKIDDGFVIVKIIDNGQGISDEVKANIFTPNFTTKSSGTGLGLAMCKRIIEQSEGEIWFETQLEKGTAFFVKLPMNNNL